MLPLHSRYTPVTLPLHRPNASVSPFGVDQIQHQRPASVPSQLPPLSGGRASGSRERSPQVDRQQGAGGHAPLMMGSTSVKWHDEAGLASGPPTAEQPLRGANPPSRQSSTNLQPPEPLSRESSPRFPGGSQLPSASRSSSIKAPGSAQGGQRRSQSVRWPEDIAAASSAGKRPSSVGSAVMSTEPLVMQVLIPPACGKESEPR